MLILLSFYQGGTMFYDNFKAACERKGTTITAVLADIGRASGNTGGWKMGKFPRLDIVMENRRQVYSTDKMKMKKTYYLNKDVLQKE